MAHSYSYLFKIPITVLRFFTVYGPWGRPDMSLYKFVKNIINNKKIFLNNFGNHSRSFTYIDDVVDVIAKLIKIIPKKQFTISSPVAPFEIYNVGNNKKITLKNFLKIIEKNLKLKAKINLRELQLGDIVETEADISKIKKIVNYFPKISLEEGVRKFVDWYKIYHNANKNFK
jgi:UDP-glucuronate 4-epimerase